MYAIVDGYLIEVSSADGLTIVRALDGTDDITRPLKVQRADGASDSQNQVKNLIDGSIAVTLMGDPPASGDLQLLYDTDTEAIAARALLARRTSFRLEVPTRPLLGMTFVRAGQLRAIELDTSTAKWELSVGYQVVQP